MATLTRSYATYIPNDNPLYVRPVQQGSVRNLSIAITPERQGILGWYDTAANELRCAVVPDFDDCFTDDVVPSGDVRTVFDGDALSRTVWVGTIWVHEGELYAFVSHYNAAGTSGKVECYIADDVENPTSWALRGTVYNEATTLGHGTKSVREGGIPTVTASGRWVLPFQTWGNFPTNALEDYISVSVSDDDGATWVTKFRGRQAPLGSGTAGPQSTTVALDPGTDDLWFGTFIGPGQAWRGYTSTDNATNWSFTEQEIPTAMNPYYYMDDGTTMYAGRVLSGAMRLYAVDDPLTFSTWTDLNMRGIVSDGITDAEGFQISPIAWPTTSSLLGVAFTAKDRIAYHPLCEPVHPPLLHIPFKDRLESLANDFTTSAISQAIGEQFENYKVIERWAGAWMHLAESGDSCTLFIPFKDHSRLEPTLSAAQSFENWKAIERWAYSISDGTCGCNCASATSPPDRCRLFVPHKDHLLDVDMTDPDQLHLAAFREFDNYKALERWANLYARGECGCTV